MKDMVKTIRDIVESTLKGALDDVKEQEGLGDINSVLRNVKNMCTGIDRMCGRATGSAYDAMCYALDGDWDGLVRELEEDSDC